MDQLQELLLRLPRFLAVRCSSKHATLGGCQLGRCLAKPNLIQVSMVFGELKLLVLIFYEGLLRQISSQTSARKMFTKLESNPSTVSITTSFDKNCPNGTYQNRALSPTQVGGWVFQSTFKNTFITLDR